MIATSEEAEHISSICSWYNGHAAPFLSCLGPRQVQVIADDPIMMMHKKLLHPHLPHPAVDKKPPPPPRCATEGALVAASGAAAC